MTINENDLTNARTAWGESMIAISQAYEKKGIDQATLVANEMLDNLYGFELGSVLFKPTLSGGNQTFRLDKEGALSYLLEITQSTLKTVGLELKIGSKSNQKHHLCL